MSKYNNFASSTISAKQILFFLFPQRLYPRTFSSSIAHHVVDIVLFAFFAFFAYHLLFLSFDFFNAKACLHHTPGLTALAHHECRQHPRP